MKILEHLRKRHIGLQLPSSGGPWLVVSAVVLIVEVVLSVLLWDWLNGGESPGATIRNVGFVIAGSVALPLALWRGVVADKQASAAQRQVDTAQQSLLNERYQKGAEMLGRPVLAVRMGGMYALQQLAHDHAGLYHIQIMKLFCALVRRPPRDPEIEPGMPYASLPRQDVQAIMAAIAARSESGRALEREAGFALDLSGSHLSWVNLQNARLNGANLSGAVFHYANLSGARLVQANLTGRVGLTGTNLSNAQLSGADLSNTTFHRTELSGTDFYGVDGGDDEYWPAKGLTQAMLDLATADSNNPPKLGGVVLDAETGEPLVWRGQSPKA